MFEFAWPWLFILLPLPLLIRYLFPASENTTAALCIPFFSRIAKVTSSRLQQGQPAASQTYLAYLAWLLLVTAAANPQWLGAPQALPRSGRDIMLALDISGSMRIPDMTLNGKAANRLQVVKAVASRFITARTGDNIGLILFGTRAYLQTPLTFDRKTVNTVLEDATIGLAGVRTAIGDAIGLAIKRLQKTPEASRVLIVLTDGANNAGVLKTVQAAKIAAKNHIKIYSIGIGANQLSVPGLFRRQIINPSSDLDERSLKEIAQITSGKYFRATNTKALRQIYQTIDKLEPITNKKSWLRPITPYYYWPLALALLISLYLARRGGNA